jgi:hypothetical protein
MGLLPPRGNKVYIPPGVQIPAPVALAGKPTKAPGMPALPVDKGIAAEIKAANARIGSLSNEDLIRTLAATVKSWHEQGDHAIGRYEKKNLRTGYDLLAQAAASRGVALPAEFASPPQARARRAGNDRGGAEM